MLKVVSDLTSRPRECQRPNDGEHRLRIPTRDASDSKLCNSTGVADRGTVCALSGAAGVKFYPTAASEASAQLEYKASGSWYSFVISSSKHEQGQLCEVARIGGGSLGTLQREAV